MLESSNMQKNLLNTTLIAAAIFVAQPAFAQETPKEAPPPVQDPLQPVPWKVKRVEDTAPDTVSDPLSARELNKIENAPHKKGTLSFTLENDVFSGNDDGYTNGFRASWTTAADKMPFLLAPIAKSIPMFPVNGDKRVSYGFGQSMFTPNDIEAYTLQPNDRPYAGWLYGSVGLVSDTGTQFDTLELTLGVVGPASLAKQTQRAVHEYITDSPEPHGWYHQLENEPGIILSYDRKWRSFYQFSALGHGVDFTPGVGASVGNVMTDAKMGATVRFGRNLPSDYGPPRVRPALSGSDFFIPTKGFSWYVFAGAEGRYVARNIFLDGNTYQDSHSVDKEHWVGDVQTGIALTFQEWRVAYTHVFRTREYETQKDAESFGAFTVSTQF
ncbi:MAG: lipid A deacylase LpxR family protein [Alphaproteobacteria bacterium]|nr:lipid A deacylase LpxR family protein [Alphaproteobacteria bacterium]